MSTIKKQIRNSRLFILGAGFSSAAGIPSTNQLLKPTMKKFKKECPGLYSRIEGHMQTCFSLGRRKSKFESLSISELCTFLEYLELREHGGGERWSHAGSREKCALRFYLSKTMAELTPESNRIPKLYLDFAKQLHSYDIVISFNWDCLLELALQKVGKPYSYNFQEHSIKLCKLHGSLNWRLKHSRPVSLDWKSFKIGNSKRIFFSKKLCSKKAWQERHPLNEIEPLLVLPGFGKGYDVRAIAFTHNTYIIGLSLSKDDFFIRSFFLDNFPYIRKKSRR
jgi:hypothetical protein